MATTAGFQERIAAFARQLSEEMGAVDATKGVCWLDSIENLAIEITNAVHGELLKQRSNDYLAQDDESVCPECSQVGPVQGEVSAGSSHPARASDACRTGVLLPLLSQIFPFLKTLAL